DRLIVSARSVKETGNMRQSLDFGACSSRITLSKVFSARSEFSVARLCARIPSSQLPLSLKHRRTRRQHTSSRPHAKFRKILKTRAHCSLRRHHIYIAVLTAKVIVYRLAQFHIPTG